MPPRMSMAAMRRRLAGKPPRRTPMQVTIELIVAHHGHTANFASKNQDGQHEFHLKIENAPYMPLVIERHGNRVMVSHYYMQNGDIMRDPEIVFALPTWEAVEITQHPLGVFREKYFERDGKRYVRTHFAAQVMPLVTMWARNLRQQGFASDGQSSSLTHPQQAKA